MENRAVGHNFAREPLKDNSSKI